ncbi:hypothetical protein SELMODRAFT_126550 [Selaginella moellendorffii]|uniref:Uncharacterized protein n=2 Tax=Selaginella moellendorffii TaxID=88036 RepID=D8SWA0_SELML|nr:hypothetical protein SELMODRAFT_126550 [Selaginella moellendorffii]
MAFSFDSSASSPEEVTSKLHTTPQLIHTLIHQCPVLVICASSCCVSLVVRELFSKLGVCPTLFDIDTDCEDGVEVERVLANLAGSKQPIPLIFVGGKLVGGLDRLMADHISGRLLRQLSEANAF